MWRAIDTAPKDGTAFIGANFEDEGMTFCGAAFWETPEDYRRHMSYPEGVDLRHEGAWVSYYESFGARIAREDRELTHWMPLPERPEGR
jgi:hypothetical protein